MPLLSSNPATGEVLRTFPTLTEDELQQRIALAAEAVQQPFVASLEHRVLALRKLSALVLAEADELARTVAMETGKPIRYAHAEAAFCAETCRYYADHAQRLLAPELLAAGQGQAHTRCEPAGVILAVMPGDSPLWHGFCFAIPALAAGNAVLLKHAGSVPQCALYMAALVRRAGFTRGSYTALLMDDSMLETALNDERVAAVTFRGPRKAGRALAAQAGWLLKRSVMHLDGSDVFVVMPSADMDAAAAACVHALALGTATGKRFILHGDIYQGFASRMVEALERLKIGNPLLNETDLGPVGTAVAVQAMREQVDTAVAAGGRVLTGGSRMVGAGYFFEPTLLSDVPMHSSVARDALPGPMALLFRAADVRDAIAIANSTPLPGDAAVWTGDPLEQQQLTAESVAAFVAVNALPPDDSRLRAADGHVSGNGRERVASGSHDFVRKKIIWMA